MVPHFPLANHYEDVYIEYNESEEEMFNPIEIGTNDFHVTFVKTDGTLRTMHGNLFGPDKGAQVDDIGVAAHLASLGVDGAPIPVFDLQALGWRSLYASKVVGEVLIG